MTIRFTKEDLELARVMPSLEDRHFLLLQIPEAEVEGEPVPRELLRSIERIEKEIKDSGYEGTYIDVAEYAEARFRQGDDIP
jgi:hypothetical protein